MFFKLKVSKIQQETEDTVSVSFAVPADLANDFQYTQGQYLTLKFDIKGKEERRAYSMSSSPLETDLTVTVKRVKKGLVSNHIADNVKEGDLVEVMLPQGRFYTALDASNRKSYYMVAAGSGITPIFSILKTVLEVEPQSFVHLLYGSRMEEGIIFKEQLDGLQARYANQISVTHILSQPKREKSSGVFSFFSKGSLNWQGLVGRISEDVMDKWLAEFPLVTKTAEYFVCGPNEMMEIAESVFLGNGATAKTIHIEHFSAAAAEKNENFKNAKLIATLNGERIEAAIPEGKTVLDTLLALKKDAPYSCTSGACSTCMAKVTAGSVKMDACYALDDDEIAAGYILTCQAHPSSEVVEINFDM